MSESLMDKIGEDIKTAMKAQDKVRLNALRYVKKLLIENKTSNTPRAELDVVIGYSKTLKDSLVSYAAGSEQYTGLEQEIAVLKAYMPSEMDEEAVKQIIRDIKASGKNQMGEIMKELSPQIKGRFDGKRASELVKEIANS